MERAARHRLLQFSIVVSWAVSVIIYVWAFHNEPPHDDEYTRWHFISLFEMSFAWICCSIPVVLIVLSLETCFRLRRLSIAVVWVGTVAYFACVKLRPFFRSAPQELGVITQTSWMTIGLNLFAFDWLFPALCVLAAALWIEKELTKRGWLPKPVHAQ